MITLIGKTFSGIALVGASWMVVASISLAANFSSQFPQIDYTDRRLNTLEGQTLDARLRVVENDMVEVKWLTRCVTAAVVGQIVMLVAARKKQQGAN